MNRRNIPWRLCRKTDDTALSAQQIQYLAMKFELDAGELTLLCKDLTWALDPDNLPRSVTHALTAEREGAMTFREAMRDISKASDLLDGARTQLRSLTMSTSVGEDKYSSPLQGLFAKLIKASVDASIVAELFKETAKAGMPTTLREPRDKRGGSGNLNRWDRWIFRATAA